MKVLFSSVLLVLLLVNCSMAGTCSDTGITRYPHPLSCSHFNLCYSGVLHEMTCPNGLFYSDFEQQCVSPLEANCNVEQRVCPLTSNPGEMLLLSNGNNCNVFFQCAHGEPVPGSCPTGLVFNRDFGACDVSECVTSHWSCRRDENEVYPDDTDCSRFYHCFNGIQYGGQCPNGWLFDSVISRCVDSRFATCGRFTTTPATTTTRVPTPGTVTTPTTVAFTTTASTTPVPTTGTITTPTTVFVSSTTSKF